jgi:branched-chain amino acid transport system substrate-binding protein
MPTSNHAGVYSSVLAYLTAVQALDSDDGAQVIAQMKKMPIDDKLFGRVTVRQDGRAVHDMFLYQVKSPQESRAPWDYYKLLSTVPAEQAFRPIEQGGCPMIK